jgi:hypothetical protein
VRSVSKCETDDPPCSDDGAYICTCPLPASRPPVSDIAFETTALPVQCRSASSVAEAARCALVMLGQSRPRLWSSRNFMKTSSRLLSLAPYERVTNVWKPRPWPSSCRTTETNSICDPGLPSSP